MHALADRAGLGELFEQVDKNSEAMTAIEDVVEHRARQDRWTSAVAWARIGAAFSMSNPSTTFRSLRIERVLDAASRRALDPVPPHARWRADSEVDTVLHVLSEGPATGGHLRFATRWVMLDAARSSSFAVTRPGMEVPELTDTAAARGGGVTVLSGSYLERAAALRTLACRFGMVICHTHPDDLVPALAFGGDYDGPPVVLMNHADHVFDLGAGNVSLLVTPRATGSDFAARVRHYPEENCHVLPIPLSSVGRARTREEAKRELGIDPGTVVALTLARATKYGASPLHPGFLEVVEPVLAGSDAILVAVGPGPDDAGWAEAAGRLGGRLRAEGMQPDPGVYLDAADVYLDSIPFVSNTSSLEAATRGIPVLTHRPYHGFHRLHSSDGVLDGGAVTTGTIGEYRSALQWLFDDADHRTSAGTAAAAAVASHSGTAWLTALEDLYQRALAAAPITTRDNMLADDPAAVRDYAAALAGIESATPLLWAVRAAVGGPPEARFDGRDRIGGWWRANAARLVAKCGGGASGADAACLLIPARVDRVSRT